ncbi:hypothetical protein J1N35_001357 [Gossypium stocksii]|uniref:Uncharacterized protein n=1 Tax=Gossypium stocksii TaxID=47602 RepID=A0A9D4AM48_9ROSI|nr:hypothetical protein J1N35_001357 [Gossypium stocksii]
MIENPVDRLEELLRKQAEVETLLEEIIHDASKFAYETYIITIDHPKLGYESQQDFGIRDKKELNMTEEVSKPINLVIDVTVNVEVDVTLTTNLELKLILSKGVNKLPILEEMPIEQVDEFFSFSFDDDEKTLVDRSSHETEVKCLRYFFVRLEYTNLDVDTTKRILHFQGSFLVYTLLLLHRGRCMFYSVGKYI